MKYYIFKGRMKGKTVDGLESLYPDKNGNKAKGVMIYGKGNIIFKYDKNGDLNYSSENELNWL